LIIWIWEEDWKWLFPGSPPFFLFLFSAFSSQWSSITYAPKKEKKNTLSSRRRKNFLVYLEGTLYMWILLIELTGTTTTPLKSMKDLMSTTP
jgi:hypothetical protein